MKETTTQTPEVQQQYPNVIIGALADAFDKSISTIERWIKEEDDRLTSDKAKEVYKKFKARG